MAQEVTPEQIEQISRSLANITPDEQRDMHALEAELSVLLAHRELIRKLTRALLEKNDANTLKTIDDLKKSTLTSFGRVLRGNTQDLLLEAKFAELEQKIEAMSHISFFSGEELKQMETLGLDSPLAKQVRAQAQQTPWADIAIVLRRLRAEWSHLQQEKQHVIIHEYELLETIAQELKTADENQRKYWATQLEMNRLALEKLLRDQKTVLESFNAFLKQQRTMQSVIDRLAEQDIISLDQIKHVIATFKTPSEYQQFMGKIIRFEKRFKPNERDAIKEFLSKASSQSSIRSATQEQAAIYRAETDILTQLPNRGVFQQRLDNELSRAQRYKRTFSTIIIDADHFKSINDTYGHDAGDRALVMIAKACQKTMRDTDVLARWGGEEFVALLPDTPKQGAIEFGNRLRDAVRSASRPLMTTLNNELKTQKGANANRAEITLSIGVATYPEDGTTKEELLAKHDQALYSAKDSGRDAVGYFEEGTLKTSNKKQSFTKRMMLAAARLVGR